MLQWQIPDWLSPSQIPTKYSQIPTTWFQNHHHEITFLCKWSSSKVPTTKTSFPFTISSWNVEPQVILISCLEMVFFSFYTLLHPLINEKESNWNLWNHKVAKSLKHLSLKFAGAVITIINSFVSSHCTWSCHLFNVLPYFFGWFQSTFGRSWKRV